jgi:hypothetical protein
MYVGIGTEAAYFLFWEHINSIFGTVHVFDAGFRHDASMISLLNCTLVL